MIRTETKICLVGLTLLLLLVGGCRVRPPLPPRPYVVVPGEPYYGEHYGSGYRYRYYPGAQVYFDTSRNIYFYFSGSVWLSAPRLPRHIHVDRDNFVTMELDEPKPYLRHRDTLKRYPPGLRKEKQGKQRQERSERRDVEQDRQEQQRRQKIERRERREDAPQALKSKPIRREEKQSAPVVRKEHKERQEKIRREEKRPGRQEAGKDRRKEQLREKEEREEERLRQKQEREEEPQEIRGRRKDPQESREEKRREEKDIRGKRSLSRKNKRGKNADDKDEYYDDMLPGGKIWR